RISAAERRNNFSHGREPVELDRTRSEPRRGDTTRHWICAAPDGARRYRNSKPRARARGYSCTAAPRLRSITRTKFSLQLEYESSFCRETQRRVKKCLIFWAVSRQKLTGKDCALDIP